MSAEDAAALGEDAPKPRVLVLYTGGTIGMKKTSGGYAPVHGFMREDLRSRPRFHDPACEEEFTTPETSFGKRIRYDLLEYEVLLDSCNMTRKDWARIANDIKGHYEDYDGFVVLHGTDTMAYTASALSFMLVNLSKPVVLTGSQIPLNELRNDAESNLMGALIIAAQFDIPEVCLYFNHKLFRGNRVTKMDASDLEAFASNNFPPLVQVGIDFKVEWERVLSPPSGPFAVDTRFNPNVAIIRFYPGLSATIMRQLLQPPIAGAILQTFGAGNAPDSDEDLLNVLQEASLRGAVIVNCTQCARGFVSAHYATGVALKRAGVVPGSDMTTEAALTKLGHLLGKELSVEVVRERMMQNLRGELTEIDSRMRFSFKDKTFIQSVFRALNADSRQDGVATLHAIRDAIAPVLTCCCAGAGALAELRGMIEHGGDVNCKDYDDRRPLHAAAIGGHAQVVEYLLQRGADPNVTDRWGCTPLHEALRHSHAPVAELLRAHGGSMRTCEMALSMIKAAHEDDAAATAALLEAGADPSGADYDGRTALHVAAAEGHNKRVRQLLAAGANPYVVDRFGNTALEDAMRHGRADTEELLRRAIDRTVSPPQRIRSGYSATVAAAAAAAAAVAAAAAASSDAPVRVLSPEPLHLLSPLAAPPPPASESSGALSPGAEALPSAGSTASEAPGARHE